MPRATAAASNHSLLVYTILLGCIVAVLQLQLLQHDQEMSSLSLIQGAFDPPASDITTGTRYCLENNNQYLESLHNLDHKAIEAYQHVKLPLLQQMASERPHNAHDHKRFKAFKPLVNCSHALSCIGGECGEDTSKIVCGLQDLNQTTKDNNDNDSNNNNKCIIYSIGGNNHWEFEEDLLKKMPSCEIHTFDCTGSVSRFQVPDHPNLHFHYECLYGGNDSTNKRPKNFYTLDEIAAKHNHTKIDLLKMDIEGFEWGVLESWSLRRKQQLEQKQPLSPLPMQILTEVHYQTQFSELQINKPSHEFKIEPDIVDLAGKLFDMGYVVVNRDDNQACKHCTELTLLKVYC